MLRIYKNSVGQRVNATLLNQDDSAPLNLTSATVVARQYSTGNDTLVVSNSCTVVSATQGTIYYDLTSTNTATAGIYYTLIDITYVGGNQFYRVGESITILENEDTIVTPSDFRKFIGIPVENSKSDEEIETLLDWAQNEVDLEVPSTINTTHKPFIKAKRNLVAMKGAILYYMTLDENNIDPNARGPKIDQWTKLYNSAILKYNRSLATTGASPSLGLRIKDSSYTNPNSPDYQTDIRS